MAESFPSYVLVIDSDVVGLQKTKTGEWVVSFCRAATPTEVTNNSAKQITVAKHTTLTK